VGGVDLWYSILLFCSTLSLGGASKPVC
jgi:hypothetical protein